MQECVLLTKVCFVFSKVVCFLAGGCVFSRSDCCCWVESVFIIGFHVFGKIVVCGRLERVFMVVVCVVSRNLFSWWIYVLLLAGVLVDIAKNLLLLERMWFLLVILCV